MTQTMKDADTHTHSRNEAMETQTVKDNDSGTPTLEG